MRFTLAVLASGLLFSNSVEAQQANDPLAELAALGDSVAESNTQEGGGSIRAKKDVDLTRDKRLKDPKNLEAKVESVKTKSFPLVAVVLKVVKPAKEGAGAGVKANETVVVVPRLKVDAGKVALEDGDTLMNAGSYYLMAGDKVMVRLGEKQKDFWQAEYIERK
jgi:hypothetical protein